MAGPTSCVRSRRSDGSGLFLPTQHCSRAVKGRKACRGGQQPEAVGLYRSAGWQQIPCYGYFKDDPTTSCFEKALTAATA